MRFLDLPREYVKKDSVFGILPIAYEKSATYGKGASKGAEEIIKASKHLEYYDERTGTEPFGLGIHTSPVLRLSRKSPKEAIAGITKAHAAMKSEFIVTLGGDHAVTLGAVQSHKGPFSVLVLDEHADYRYSWNGSQLNHACVGRRIAAKHSIGVVGVRSLDKDEHEALLKDSNMHILSSYDYTQNRLIEMLAKLEENVYLSIDVDVFDPSFIRNTGTPEPGGLFWEDVMQILQVVFSNRTVIGADIVEFAPQENYRAEAYALAKLCYRMMALKAKTR